MSEERGLFGPLSRTLANSLFDVYYPCQEEIVVFPTCAWRSSPAKWNGDQGPYERRRPRGRTAIHLQSGSPRPARRWAPVPPADPYVEFIFTKVGNVGQKFCGIVVHGLTCEDPTHVSPETAVTRRVRVTLLVRVLVMYPMCGDPKYWPAFQSQRAAHSEEIFHPPRRLVAAMRQQAMVAHPDAQAPGGPPQHHREQARFPAEYEQRSQSANVKCHHNEGGDGKKGQCPESTLYLGHHAARR
jgi:hypothetical protein